MLGINIYLMVNNLEKFDHHNSLGFNWGIIYQLDRCKKALMKPIHLFLYHLCIKYNCLQSFRMLGIKMSNLWWKKLFLLKHYEPIR